MPTTVTYVNVCVINVYVTAPIRVRAVIIIAVVLLHRNVISRQHNQISILSTGV